MIKDITLDKESKYYLQVRGLRKQYEKVKKFILSGYLELADFKIRQPKQDGVYSFRINGQYRALGRFLGVNIFEVFEIYDHKR